MYNPAQLYGFARSPESGEQVFFRLEVFWAGDGDVPPLLGERVEVEYDPARSSGDKPPPATRVERVDPPVLLYGTVDQFDSRKAWGFVKGDDKVSYHLHRSEVLDGRLPLRGARVSFYGGTRRDRPRACYVTVLNE
jgi:cold shock CspA family protein